MRAVVTDKGRITCDKLVICAGQWSREIGRMAGVNIPLVSVQHQYLITEAIDGVTRDLPTLRDPDRLTYWKEEVGGLVMGGYEPNPKPWAVDGLPDRLRVPTSRRRSGALRAAARARRRPRAGDADGRHQAVHQRPGELHAGRQLHPRRGARGARRLCRRRLQRLRHRGRRRAPAWRSPNGSPRASRLTISGRSTFAGSARTISTPSWVRTRTLEAYAKHYTMAWPFEEYRSGRPFRRSPLYDRLKAQGACFGEKLGWERPNWFADLATRGEGRGHLQLRAAELVRCCRP